MYGRTHLGIALAIWSRYQYLELSSPVYHNQFAFGTRPRRPVDDLTTALKPFSDRVWIGIGVMTLVITLSFRVLTLASREESLSGQVVKL